MSQSSVTFCNAGRVVTRHTLLTLPFLLNPLLNLPLPQTHLRAFTPNQARISQIGIKIGMTAGRAFYFYIVFPEFDFIGAVDACMCFDIFWLKVSRIHAWAS